MWKKFMDILLKYEPLINFAFIIIFIYGIVKYYQLMQIGISKGGNINGIIGVLIISIFIIGYLCYELYDNYKRVYD